MTPSEKLEKSMSAKHSTARGDAEVNDDNTEHEWVEELPKHTRAHQAKHDDDRLTTMMTRHPAFRRAQREKIVREMLVREMPDRKPRRSWRETDHLRTWVVLSEGRVNQNCAKMRKIS